MSHEVVIAVIASGALTAAVTTLGALWVRVLDRRKHATELEILHAERIKIEAEVEDLESSRLIRELDALSESNRMLMERAAQDRDFIDRLRTNLFEYAQREAEHAIENATLRQRIRDLEARTPAPLIKSVLDSVYKPIIPHRHNEFDDKQE